MHFNENGDRERAYRKDGEKKLNIFLNILCSMMLYFGMIVLLYYVYE